MYLTTADVVARGEVAAAWGGVIELWKDVAGTYAIVDDETITAAGGGGSQQWDQ